MTLPLEREKIISFKFLEAACLASWIPFLGVIFFFLAYGNVGKTSCAGYSFFCAANSSLAVVTPLFAAPFFALSCFFGYLLTLFVVRFLNLKAFFLIAGLFLVFMGIWYFKFQKHADQSGLLLLLSNEVVFLKYSKLWFLPYSWPAYGLISFEDGDWKKCLLYLANLWSLAILCLTFVPLFRKYFVATYFLQRKNTSNLAEGRDYVGAFFSGFRMPLYLRAFLIKDVKLFAREPALWLQFLVFFGILFFYFLNIRWFSYHLLDPMWKNLITFLNAFGILCIVSSMSIRFVFPQWSLEGKSFWILKLAPLSLKIIFLEKFLIAGVLLSFISVTLIAASNHMLKLTPFFSYLTIFIILISALTMVCVSLGLGGYFANFHEEYYVKAVESLGGFIAIIVTFCYVILTVSLFLGITHFHFTERLTHFRFVLIVALSLWSMLSVAASFVSLWLGIKRLELMEY